jgi:two-component system, chemotaxis family, sensor kinase CheA
MVDEILQEFLIESRENLDQLDRELVALEGDPRNPSRLASIFRTVHTIKGTAGFFQFAKLEAVAHVGENLLSRMRDGVIVLDRVRTTALLAMLDAIRVLLTQIEASEAEGEGEYGNLIAALSAACHDEKIEEAATLLGLRSADTQLLPALPVVAPLPQPFVKLPSIPVPAAAAPPAAAPPAAAPPAVAATLKAAVAQGARVVTPVPAPPTTPQTPAVKSGPAEPGRARAPSGREHEHEPAAPERHAVDPRIRVDVRLLDRLMNLVGELVLARNQLLQHASGSAEAGLLSTCQRLNLITTELQEGVMKTRMQPIENVWNRFPRVVRDLSQLCGKQVRLEMEGGSTELDKTIIEAIGDPLTHLVRNSIDHGIELPEKRAAAGKPALGTLRLRAYHEGGRVNIEISDDGNGIDAERIKTRAVERGLITPDRARTLAEHEVYALLFLPGFSTAETVTNISGRGVGLDVVKSNIERLGGNVDIDSQVGRGSTFRIRIPLTLAIIPALMIGAAGERFAIPQVNLVELVRIDVEQARTLIERIHGVPVYRLRGNLLPLVELSRVLELSSSDEPRDLNMIVLQADDRQFGLLVDHIFDTEEIVVKPLGRELKGLDTYAGATIMGDGRVALILDVAGLAERAGVASSERRIALEDEARQRAQQPVDSEQLLLFRSGQTVRMAIPLAAVARLEEFARGRIEHVGGEEVVQYRGQILPLVHLSEVFGLPRGESEMLQVLVHANGTRQVGFVVDAIEDVIEQQIVSSRRGGRAGTLGSAVIQGRVTEILDAEAVRGLVGG